MLVENNDKKIAMKRPMRDMNPEDFKPKGDKPKITETTNTKKIEGYTCKQIWLENATDSIELWVSTEVGLTSADVLSLAGSTRGPAMGNDMSKFYWSKGVSLETNITRKADGEKTAMHIINIKKESVPDATFSTEGYQEMQMPQMNGMHPGAPGEGK
jgi:hypothetical protein